MVDKSNRTLPFTVEQREQIARLARCTMFPGSWDKRFVRSLRDAPADYLISAAQAKSIDLLYHRYRRQLTPEPAKNGNS
jgi:hypothetical protein